MNCISSIAVTDSMQGISKKSSFFKLMCNTDQILISNFKLRKKC